MLKTRKDKKQRSTRNSYDYRENSNYRSSYDYEQVDLNDEYEYDYDTSYDVDFAYDDYAVFDREPRYVEPHDEPRYSSFRGYSRGDNKIRSERKSKKRMSASMKALVVVYFAIVAVISCLLIINALPMMNSNPGIGIEGMENVEQVEIDANAINNVVLADGTVITLAAQQTVPYEYTINSNWFDDMCDWMENLVA